MRGSRCNELHGTHDSNQESIQTEVNAIIEHGVRGTGIRSRLPILVQGSPCGKLKALIDMLLRWLGHLYACAALTKSCNEEQLSHLTVDRKKSYAVQRISPLIIVPPMIEFMISKHVSHSMSANFNRYHNPSPLHQSTFITPQHHMHPNSQCATATSTPVTRSKDSG